MIKENEYYLVGDKRLTKLPKIMTGKKIINEFIARGYHVVDKLVDDIEYGPSWKSSLMTDEEIQEELKTWDIEEYFTIDITVRGEL